MFPDFQQLPQCFRRPTFWLALLGIFHFALSCATWGILAFRWNIAAAELIDFGYLPAVLACVLLLLFAGAPLYAETPSSNPSLFAGMFQDVVGSRARIIQVSFIFVAAGILILYKK